MSTLFRRASVLAALLSLASVAPGAWGQDALAPAALGPSLTGAARADYESARSLYAERDFGASLIKFTAAYAASKDPRLLWNMASCEEKRRHYTKALALLRRFVDEGGALLTGADRADAARYIRAIEPLTSMARIDVSEPGAEVYVDDERVGTSPLAPLALDVGVHALRVRKADFHDVTERVTISGGEIPIAVTLLPVVHEGRLAVRAPARAAIALDGAPIGVGSWSGAVRSGGHTLRVTEPGMTAYQSEVLVQDGQSREVSVTLTPEAGHGLLPTWAWIAGGVVLAGGIGAGGYFLLKPASKTPSPPSGTIGTVPSGAAIRF
jgi:hypothetical protein